MNGTAKDSKFLYNRAGVTLNNGSTLYVEVPVDKGAIGCQIAWLDATSSATITLELTSFGMTEAPYDAAAAQYWAASGVAITGPAAAAIGSTVVNATNIFQKRARLKIVTAANSKIQVLTP